MRLRLLVLMLLTILSTNYGMRVAHCGSEWLALGSAKPNVSKDDAIGLFTDANEKYTQAAKLAAGKNNLEAAQLLQEAALQYERYWQVGSGTAKSITIWEMCITVRGSWENRSSITGGRSGLCQECRP